MSTADATLIGVKLQAAGENLNTWGDPNLNNDLIVLARASHGWNSKTINGDTTISETNYSTTNDTEVATIKLVAGTVAAAFNLVLVGRARRLLIWNATGFTATPKLSTTAGFSLPNGCVAMVATDGVADVYNLSPNFIGTGHVVTNSGDVTNKAYVDTAIATAGLPATAGTVLNSGGDTTAGYLSQKITVSGSLVLTTTNPGGNEKANIAFVYDEGQAALFAGSLGA